MKAANGVPEDQAQMERGGWQQVVRALILGALLCGVGYFLGQLAR